MLAPLPEDCMGCLNSPYLPIPLNFLYSFPDVWGRGPICWEPLKSAGAKDARNNSYFRSLSVDLTYGTFWNPFVLIAFSFDSGPLWLWISFPFLPIFAFCFILDIKSNMGRSPLVLLIPAQVLIFFCSIRQSIWQESNCNVCSGTQLRLLRFFFLGLLALSLYQAPGSLSYRLSSGIIHNSVTWADCDVSPCVVHLLPCCVSLFRFL